MMEKMKADVPDMTTRMSCQEIRPAKGKRGMRSYLKVKERRNA